MTQVRGAQNAVDDMASSICPALFPGNVTGDTKFTCFAPSSAAGAGFAYVEAGPFVVDDSCVWLMTAVCR
jgi:hypothetical protein